MAHAIFRSLFLLLILASLGCAQRFETDYDNVIGRAAPSQWDVVDVRVNVPRDLTVSEANSFAPKADIVWRGDPKGDRYIQVQQIFRQAGLQGTANMTGQRPVYLDIQVHRFHAMTEKARYTLTFSGVHNIRFSMVVRDAATGVPISPVDTVRADLAAYVGEQALRADAAGITQKHRIVSHLRAVISGWLQNGEDVRGNFSRAGF